MACTLGWKGSSKYEEQHRKKCCRVRQSNKAEAILSGEAAGWDIVGHKSSEVCKSQ